MIGRSIGLSVAAMMTAVVVTGMGSLIALDIGGPGILSAAWGALMAPKPSAPIAVLENAKDITFFSIVPVDGYAFEIATGVSFENEASLAAGLEGKRWCYAIIAVDGRIPRQVELASSNDGGTPEFVDVSVYPLSEVTQLGVNADELNDLARQYCDFEGQVG